MTTLPRCPVCDDAVYNGDDIHPCCANARAAGLDFCAGCAAAKAGRESGRRQGAPVIVDYAKALASMQQTSWAVRHLLDDDTCRRAHVEPQVVLVMVDDVQPGKHNIDKGPTYRPPDDDVIFHFVESGRKSRCGYGAFGRCYIPWSAPDG